MVENKLMTADEIFDKAMATMAPLPSQESCARDLAAIFSFHITKMELMDAGFAADELPQQHAIMVAPTGVGKTYLLRHIAQVCNVNVIFMDGSSVTRDGWKGVSFGQQLWTAKNALKDDEKYARSIVFVDEVDKMRTHKGHSEAGNVMDNFLQLFNGGQVNVELEGRQIETIDVSRFTVIMGGAFAGLEEIIRRRMAPKASVGFTSASTTNIHLDDRTILHHATPEDLQEYGIKKELIARIGCILHINPLEVEDYRRLLTAEVGSVRANYRNYFSHGFGVDFDISDEAIRQIAEQCSKTTTGARAVTPIVNKAMRSAVAEVGKDRTINKVILTANDDGCLAQYEHGARTLSSITDCFCGGEPYCINVGSISSMVNHLFRVYNAVGCNLDFSREFKLFIQMTLTYLFENCRESERTFDSLCKLARTTDKAAGDALSPYEIIISDYLQRPDHNPSMDKWFNDFRRTWTKATARKLSRALTTIRRHLMQKHKCSTIIFRKDNAKATEESA